MIFDLFDLFFDPIIWGTGLRTRDNDGLRVWVLRFIFLHYFIFPGRLNARSDVYSFGVVLLRDFTRKEALDFNRPAEEEDLVEWARPYLTSKRKVVRIVDPRLDTQYLPEEAVRMASIADWRCSVLEIGFIICNSIIIYISIITILNK